MKLLTTAVVVIVATTGFLLLNSSSNENVLSDQTAGNTQVDQQPTSVPTTSGLSLEEVAKHDNENDCWLVLDKKVYYVTKFIPSHPGGKAILQGCGKDATKLFETRPMGSGTPHSERARMLREDFFIGNLE